MRQHIVSIAMALYFCKLSVVQLHHAAFTGTGHQNVISSTTWRLLCQFRKMALSSLVFLGKSFFLLLLDMSSIQTHSICHLPNWVTQRNQPAWFQLRWESLHRTTFLCCVLKLVRLVVNLWLLSASLAGTACKWNEPSFTRISGRRSGRFFLPSQQLSVISLSRNSARSSMHGNYRNHFTMRASDGSNYLPCKRQ